jgi:DHA1 family bicyclomycin/chloramphenicol resistance-like MFS transporter
LHGHKVCLWKKKPRRLQEVNDSCTGISENTHGPMKTAARLFGLIGLIMFIAPAAAPSLGSLMLALGEWQWILLMLAGYAAFLVLTLQVALFPKLQPRIPTTTPIRSLVTNYLLVLRHKTTMRFIGIQVLCFSTMLLFITHSPFIYQEWSGLSNSTFAILFAANIAFMAALNLINRPLLRRFSWVQLVRAPDSRPGERSWRVTF